MLYAYTTTLYRVFAHGLYIPYVFCLYTWKYKQEQKKSCAEFVFTRKMENSYELIYIKIDVEMIYKDTQKYQLITFCYKF